MIDPVAVERYSQAIFDAAHKAKVTEKVDQDLLSLSREFQRSGLKAFLENPKYSFESKARVIDKVGNGLSSDLSVKFLHLLLKKNRINLLESIALIFAELEREAKGIVPCEVVLAAEPEKGFLDKIETALKRIPRKKVMLTVQTNPFVIGGITVRIKNRILDATFKTRLSELKDLMLEVKLSS